MSFHPPMLVPYPKTKKSVTDYSSLPRGWEYHVTPDNRLVFYSDTSELYTFNDPRIQIPEPGSEVQWIFEDPENILRFIDNQRNGRPSFHGSIFDTRGINLEELDGVPDLIPEYSGNYEDNSGDSWEEQSITGIMETMKISSQVDASTEREPHKTDPGEHGMSETELDTPGAQDVDLVKLHQFWGMSESGTADYGEEANKGSYSQNVDRDENMAIEEADKEKASQEEIIEMIKTRNDARSTAQVLADHQAKEAKLFRTKSSGRSDVSQGTGKEKETEEDVYSPPGTPNEDEESGDEDIPDEEEAFRRAIEASKRDLERSAPGGDKVGEASGSGSREGKDKERERRDD